MMVSMSDRIGKGQSPLPLWHETVERLAFVFFPMVAVLMLTATDLIVALYTPAYAASAPIFMVSIAFIVLAAFPADAVLRVYAETRTLLVLNIFRLVFIAGAIGAFVAQFQLRGAVLVTLTSAVIAKGLAMVRCGSLMGTSAATLLPWRSLAGIGVAAALAVVPAWLVKALMPGGGLLAASVTASVYGLSYLAVVSLGSLVRAAAAPAVVEGTCAE
jgi:O-antigen/teichoic acid export membrane protein